RLAVTNSNIEIKNITACSHENQLYYDADYKIFSNNTSEWKQYKTIFVYSGIEYDASFNEINGPIHFKNWYEKFLKAKQEGKKKSFTDAETAKHLDNFFKSQEPKIL
ncbi:MAG: hypothetical protein RSB20_01910, partial [Clostridia bacterium]